ncbi:hypothetical protein EELLY_v1c07290 [Entomoplasma ellychniae]|uniref:Uncharacterized protein n=1 Tax=Entomoplasma ellychniae TaxID=2114 RepID=A0A8E2UAZ7_9MOLU|nr:hypothetical protein [Entomoplasma ellychniae]PPE05041.1 hypothetical protein EELLY_v1c07290 [Entomoplasma ellychniae]
MKNYDPKRKIIITFVFLLILIFYTFLVFSKISSTDSHKYAVDYEKIEKKIDDYSKQKESFKNLDEFEEGINLLNFDGVSLSAFDTSDNNSESNEEIYFKNLNVKVIFRLNKNYYWKQSTLGTTEQSHIYQITIDKRIIVEKTEIEKELNEIISDIDYEQALSSAWIKNQIKTSEKSNLNVWYILNVSIIDKDDKENQNLNQENFEIKITIGLRKSYKWLETGNQENLTFEFTNNIYILKNKIDLFDEIVDIKKFFKSKTIKSYEDLENITKEKNNEKTNYKIDLLSKNETINKEYIVELQLSLNDGFEWKIGDELSKAEITLNFTINNLEEGEK